MDKKYISKQINEFNIVNKETKILELCKDKDILNVGCVGQDKYYESETWQHKKIADVSKSTIGVDINIEEIENLKQLGYRVVATDELINLSKTFDVIVISDVIEHVDNAKDFIEFYSQFLNQQGIMIISTPNAFYFARFIWILIWKNYSVNDEHTLWYCPLTLAELISRTQVKINDFYWCEEYFNIRDLNIRYRWIYRLSRFIARSRKNLSPNFMVVLSK